MPDDFAYDVFLSHSARDKAVVRPLVERLRKDGLNVWCDEWALKPGDSIQAKIEEGLGHSRVLVLCMSARQGLKLATLDGSLCKRCWAAGGEVRSLHSRQMATL
jgi:hypothetical protein